MSTLASGVVIAAGAAYFAKPMGAVDNYAVMVLAGAALGLGSLGPAIAVPKLVLANGKAPDAEEEQQREALLSQYTTSKIIGSALLEGAAMLNVVAYFLEANPLSLIIAGILIVILMGIIPSRNRIAEWLDMRMLEVRRQGSGL
ncbi:MAG: hypothetical protein KDB14_31670 [Planctomycetales bacterium]|nr:hypothetical protein [Planctomycetales bacterium]